MDCAKYLMLFAHSVSFFRKKILLQETCLLKTKISCGDIILFQVRNNIPISHINAVERVDKHAFARSNIAQVITKNSQGHTELLYFQAKVIDITSIKHIHRIIHTLQEMILITIQIEKVYNVCKHDSSLCNVWILYIFLQ